MVKRELWTLWTFLNLWDELDRHNISIAHGRERLRASKLEKDSHHPPQSSQDFLSCFAVLVVTGERYGYLRCTEDGKREAKFKTAKV